MPYQAGEAHITTWINGLALVFAVYLAVLRAVELEPASLFGAGFVPCTALALVAGACVVQFCANMVTAHGVGNGSSLVICTGIVTGTHAYVFTWLVVTQGGIGRGHSQLTGGMVQKEAQKNRRQGIRLHTLWY